MEMERGDEGGGRTEGEEGDTDEEVGEGSSEEALDEKPRAELSEVDVVERPRCSVADMAPRRAQHPRYPSSLPPALTAARAAAVGVADLSSVRTRPVAAVCCARGLGREEACTRSRAAPPTTTCRYVPPPLAVSDHIADPTAVLIGFDVRGAQESVESRGGTCACCRSRERAFSRQTPTRASRSCVRRVTLSGGEG